MKHLFLLLLLISCGCTSVATDTAVTPQKGENGKYGYVDKGGKVVVPFKYAYAAPFGELNLDNLSLVCTEPWWSPYIASGTSTGKCGMVNKKGELAVPVIYSCILRASDGLAAVNDGEYIEKGLGDSDTRSGKWGFINGEGKLVIPLQYDAVGNFFNGVCFVNKGGKWGMIFKTGENILPFEYDKLEFAKSGDSVRVQKQEDVFWTDLKGKKI